MSDLAIYSRALVNHRSNTKLLTAMRVIENLAGYMDDWSRINHFEDLFL